MSNRASNRIFMLLIGALFLLFMGCSLPWMTEIATEEPPPPGSEFNPASVTIPIEEPPGQSPVTAEGAATPKVLDDFEGSAPPETDGWETYFDETTGINIHCATQSQVVYHGKSSLQIDYKIDKTDGWASCSLSFWEARDWSAYKGLDFWMHASRDGLPFDVLTHAGTFENRETYAHRIITDKNSVQSWTHVFVPWQEIRRVEWEANPGTPLNPAHVLSIAFLFNGIEGDANQGTLYIDNLTLVNGEALPEEPAAQILASATPSQESQTPFASPSAKLEPPETLPVNLVQPPDFEYQGAFRLPDDGDRPRTFAYGGSAMTVFPGGDPGGGGDGFPGSLFVMGHERIPYGELPNGNQVAELSIPAPVISKDLAALPVAEFLQGFQDVAKGHFAGLDEIPRAGMQFLDNPLTGPKIHITWGAHFQEDERTNGPALAWFNPNLAEANMQGEWYLGNQAPYSVNGYMLAIPPDWAEKYTQGRQLGTGRYRDGGWSGMGPALFAYRPWNEAGMPPPNGTRLGETVLLLYAKSIETNQIERALEGYQHADEWEGAAWLTTSSGKQAVLFAGTKGSGKIYWYGFANPQGPDKPCAFAEYVGQFDLCRYADGKPCPMEMQQECAGHTSERGWWTDRKSAVFLLYNPERLGQVALGQIESWEPQPYAVVEIDPVLLMNPTRTEEILVGTGIQRRYRIGDVSYDREHALLYVLELYTEDAKPVVHVWRMK